jgi:tRNA threonylcarbamoyladenosine biosynthesis protein TsaE
MQCTLSNLDQTAELGHTLAQIIVSRGPCPVLISGPLGAGKTTLIRCVVENLPGGDQAEVSSPSFNLFNIYSTRPEVIHADLYRLGRAGMDESLAECLDTEHAALFIEWAEYLPWSELPANYLRLTIEMAGQGRLIRFQACGDRAEAWLHALGETGALHNG